MKVHRFLIKNCNLSSRLLRFYDREVVNQIKNVLKLRVGEEVVVGDGNENEARVRILEIKKDFVEGEISEVFKNENELDTAVVLYCALLKRENFEWVVQKATEVGVSEIVPVIARRTIKLGLNMGRLEKIAREAAEQSARGRIPVLQEAMSLVEALQDAHLNGVNLFFDKSGKLPEIGTNLYSERIGVFIGPEGGWDEGEIELAKEKKCEIVGLSPLTFRAETAAVVGSYLAGHFYKSSK